MNIYIYIILSIFCVLIVSYVLRKRKTEPFQNVYEHIYFMEHSETSKFLSKDDDQYVYSLTPIDLYARKAETHKQYLDIISNLSISFNSEERQKIFKCVSEADAFFKNINFNHITNYKHINGNDIANIKWIFSLTYSKDGKQYEEGLPHTRANIIFLSKTVMNYTDDSLTSTLIHEKVHIYQRYNKALFDKIIYNMNYRILDLSKINNKEFIRSNPDLNKNIYYDLSTNKEMICFYRNDKPSSISDVIINNFSLEHPYEKIAYDIANLYYKKDVHKYISI